MKWPLSLSHDRLDDGEVALRSYDSADAEDLYEALRDDRAWEHIPRTVPTDFGSLDAGIAAAVATGTWLTFTVRRAGIVVGRTSLIWDPTDPRGVEIGEPSSPPRCGAPESTGEPRRC
ncbi:GNAT family N-acetyltransferase [Nocardia sp. NPDC055321]